MAQTVQVRVVEAFASGRFSPGKIFGRLCRKPKVGKQFRSFALEYYKQKTRSSNVPFYPMALLTFYGSHLDAKSTSKETPSGLDVGVIESFYTEIIDSLDRAENPEFMEFYLNNYDILSTASYLKSNFIFIDDPEIQDKIFNSNRFKDFFQRTLGKDMESYKKVFKRFGVLMFIFRDNLDILFQGASMSKDEFFSNLRDENSNIYKMSENGLVECFNSKKNIFGKIVDATSTLEEIIDANI